MGILKVYEIAWEFKNIWWVFSELNLKKNAVQSLFELYNQRNFIWKVYGGVGVICGSAVHCSVLSVLESGGVVNDASGTKLGPEGGSRQPPFT